MKNYWGDMFYHEFNSKLYGIFGFQSSSNKGFAFAELNSEQNSPGFQL